MTTTVQRRFACQDPMTMQAPMQAPMQPSSAHQPLMCGATKPLPKDAFDVLMDQYPMYEHVFKKLAFSANGVAFAHESKLTRFEGMSMEAIAKEKAVQQLQAQSLLKGGNVILSMRCEFQPNRGAGICICTVHATAVTYAHKH